MVSLTKDKALLPPLLQSLAKLKKPIANKTNRLRAFARINKGRLARDEVTKAAPPLQSLANSEKPVAKKMEQVAGVYKD